MEQANPAFFTSVSVPEVQQRVAQHLANIYKQINTEIPHYILDYLKFSCLIDARQLRRFLGSEVYEHSIKETLSLLRDQ